MWMVGRRKRSVILWKYLRLINGCCCTAREPRYAARWNRISRKNRAVVMPEPELTCKELVELVTDYLEGALSPADRARFEEHLSMCTGCRNYVEQLRDTLRLVGTLTEDHLSPRVRDDLLGAFRTWRRG